MKFQRSPGDGRRGRPQGPRTSAARSPPLSGLVSLLKPFAAGAQVAAPPEDVSVWGGRCVAASEAPAAQPGPTKPLLFPLCAVLPAPSRATAGSAAKREGAAVRGSGPASCPRYFQSRLCPALSLPPSSFFPSASALPLLHTSLALPPREANSRLVAGRDTLRSERFRRFQDSSPGPRRNCDPLVTSVSFRLLHLGVTCHPAAGDTCTALMVSAVLLRQLHRAACSVGPALRGPCAR
ncbi:PREDICTED: uncharacterized protein LOC106149869 [Chinchilla lanigera]|uniref:uncharacterized protein LOC106149869 n=1 Tax=Chinchilla lanigera TaxID=34839 RepID=UPI000695B16B|nr:PREDICTED: uncharacterized protein LOC106149869 [Chinchilla lanigera]